MLVGRDIKSQSNFDPNGTQAIPDLFDEYDRAWTAYNTNGDESLSQAFVYAQIDEVPDKRADMFLPRFRDVANYLQLPNVDLRKQFELIKGSPYTENELEVLAERERYAKIWLEKYAPEDFQTQMSEEMPEQVRGLTEKQKEYLSCAIVLLEKENDAEKLQIALYELSKEVTLPASAAFGAIYLSLIGKTHGPKAAWFLLQYPKEQVLKRLKEASSLK
ncbi:MAG: lysyl-tRNA synthetase, class I [Microgenomates group bacterium Gr01-1014_5]|nr:MAG: lysyl-tRNA synthetase, class I [Microgenomates group bacterium Gr01-1014_5]